MSASLAAPVVNGFAPLGPTTVKEVAEYEKILRLRDEILAGTHPRLSVHSQARAQPNRKVPSLPAAPSPTAAINNVPQPALSAARQLQLPGLGRGSEEPPQEKATKSILQTTTTLSGIDPVLLTKSDDLVRAEIQLLRQRLEKSLRDQFEQKRLDARRRPAPGEAKPDFDVATVLAKALEIVKPDTGSNPRDDASVSSFGDSLYSSKGPDSTPEAGELEDEASPQNQTSFAGGIDANGSTEAQAMPGRLPSAAQPGRFLPSAMVPSDPKSQYDPLNPSIRDLTKGADLSGPVNDDDEEEEEGEYSPPEAIDHVVAALQGLPSQPMDPRSRPLRRYSDVENAGPGSSHEGNVRIVRNHITSPAAPQPSRVSPLAVAKDSIISQNNRARNGRGGQRGRGEPSPEPPGANIHPRKRRKLERIAAKKRRAGGGSPDVKDEPISPPPFHDVQPLGSGRVRSTANEPIMIDDGPPEIRYVRAPGQYVEPPARPMSRMMEAPMPLSEPRAVSRSAMRPMRDEMDLRRVASLQSMRTEQPRHLEHVYDSPSRGRAASYVQLDSPARAEPPRYAQTLSNNYDQDPEPGMRVVRTPAPSYREVYQDYEPEVRYIPQPMPPPPPMERIVIDEFGRKYREIVQERPSIIPRAAPTYADRESLVYDNYNPPRAGSVMIQPPHDDRYAEDMPPPRMMRPAMASRSMMYEPAPDARAMSVTTADRQPRQPTYIDEVPDYRTPTRLGSVRPMPTRYDERPPVEMIPRNSSVRPGGRESSVYVDDRTPLRREYIPIDRPQYQMLEPQTRYIDAQGREVIMESRQEGGARYAQQY